ncbi:hypothetical protein OSTLU_119512 [Ostreococcus lucimarinus CCE9901]|uniref:Uncharacterized protein n=1 Tax=Ostreococcus lucimarinus (strain CCE9901) TaxID=436017 RepID=A4RT03_OSTLU|nr:hypothetical protein OSTLU_119512 [Ostreococcus lucimarinus CCE9901]ABO94692.1 hypothetical protein OSTLU_119512 [Ostreococcus lucimarinus CCE9901]|eukprot:XP_001416399.1 hypothetical protein OSTLU_119512 [Ostreococcus lucimarinus CCE9901]
MVTRAVAFQCAPTSAYKKTRLNVCKSSGGKVPRAPHRPSASHNAGSFPREDRLLDKDNFSQSPQRKLESGWFCRQRETLKNLGPAGMVSYGALNSCYYTCAYIYCLQRSSLTLQGRFLEVAVLVWAGSQVTKALRVWLAVVLTPITSILLSQIEQKYTIKRTQATLIAICAMLLASIFCLTVFICVKKSSLG